MDLLINMDQQGFRKYLTQSKDHEELLAFLLGNLVKEKARYHMLQRHEQPESIVVKLKELEARVLFFHATADFWTLMATFAGQRTRNLRRVAFHSFEAFLNQRIQVRQG